MKALLILLVLSMAVGMQLKNIDLNSWAIQLQNADPNLIAKSSFSLVVIDYSRDGSERGAYSPEEIKKIKEAGTIPIAYLSIGEAEDYRFYWREEWYTNPPEWLGKENTEWDGNYAVKYWNKEWKKILHTYLDKVIAQGFAGVYLDRVDEFEYWADSDESLSENETARMMIDLILDIISYSRNKAGCDFYIIPQNGERILKYDNGTLLNLVSGWAAEDLFYNGTASWSEEEMNWVEENRFPYLDMVLSKGKPVFSVDYVDDGSKNMSNKKRIENYLENARKRGYLPYVALSDRELDELNVVW